MEKTKEERKGTANEAQYAIPRRTHAKKKQAKEDSSPPKNELSEIKALIGNLDTKFTAIDNKFSAIEKKVDEISDEHNQLMNKGPSNSSSNGEQEASCVVDNIDLGHLSDESDDDFGSIQEQQPQEDGYVFNPVDDDSIVGKDIEAELASKFSKGMVASYNIEQSKQIMELYPRPKNILPLKTPIVNSELTKTKEMRRNVASKDTLSRTTQDLITASISACAGIMSDVKEDAISRKECYAKLGDMAKMLMDAHKRVSQIRRNQMRPLLSGAYRGVCAYANIDNFDNEWLFGHNFGRTAEEVAKASRLTAKIVEQPTKNWRQRGRGGSIPRGKSSHFHSKGQWQKRKDQSQTSHHQHAKYPKKE